MFDLTGKVAVITGARRGMGRAHAAALARQGATVILTDVDLVETEAAAADIRAAGAQAAAFQLDVSKKSEVDTIFDAIIAQFGRVDILVNNAGIFRPKPALEMTEEEWDTMLSVNLKGQFLCAQRAAREMAKQKWGRIINIASIASGGVGVGVSSAAHYTASKGGIIGMTETLAIEWAPLGITVNVIAPGAIDTPMASSADMSKETLDQILSGIPLGRMGRSEEVAAVAVFLSSGESSYVTGATYVVDGGWLAA